jgi:alpha-methylacyl-CoA racemase
VLTPARPRATRTTVARDTFFEPDGVLQPSPAPRFSRTPATRPEPAPYIGEHDDELL